MLIDTHCHLNMMVKEDFDRPLKREEYEAAKDIIQQASESNVKKIINVGTSYIESLNSIYLAEQNSAVYSSIGIHPNDLTDSWKKELLELEKFIKIPKYKIVAIGECGIDMYRPGYNLERQKDAFKTQIELTLKHNLALVVHTRSAGQETLSCLEEFKNSGLRGTIHCFSEDLHFAKETIDWGFVLGIGGTITYPKNNILRDVVVHVGLSNIVLETDAPFLPPQQYRGQQNHPKYIKLIAQYIAQLLNSSETEVALKTTGNVSKTFGI